MPVVIVQDVNFLHAGSLAFHLKTYQLHQKNNQNGNITKTNTLRLRLLQTDASFRRILRGLPGNYCKECRKSASRKHRKAEKRTLVREDREPYPVITSTKDPELRRKLILSALQTVRASIKQKKQKLCEVETELDD